MFLMLPSVAGLAQACQPPLLGLPGRETCKRQVALPKPVPHLKPCTGHNAFPILAFPSLCSPKIGFLQKEIGQCRKWASPKHAGAPIP